MSCCCLFVDLHQEGSAPAACAVGLFSLYIEKNIYVVLFFFKAGSKTKVIRRIGLSKKKRLVLHFFSGKCLKISNVQLGTPKIFGLFGNVFSSSSFPKKFQNTFYNANSI